MKHLPLYILIALFSFNFLNAQKLKEKNFTLDCDLKNDYSGYIYLEYENKKDSCLIVKNHFSFSGAIKNAITSATFSLKNKNSNSPDLYLEPGEIILKMAIEEKTFDGNSNVTFMKIDAVKGSKTTQTANEYSTFLKDHYSDKDVQQQLYKRVDTIVTQNPQNPLGCSLICGLSRSETVDKSQLKKIYSKLDRNNQNPMLLTIIDKNLQQ